MEAGVANKKCKKCQEDKPTTEFYKHESTRDRLFTHCKPCHKGDMRKASRDRYYLVTKPARGIPDRNFSKPRAKYGDAVE